MAAPSSRSQTHCDRSATSAPTAKQTGTPPERSPRRFPPCVPDRIAPEPQPAVEPPAGSSQRNCHSPQASAHRTASAHMHTNTAAIKHSTGAENGIGKLSAPPPDDSSVSSTCILYAAANSAPNPTSSTAYRVPGSAAGLSANLRGNSNTQLANACAIAISGESSSSATVNPTASPAAKLPRPAFPPARTPIM